eukprot:504093-Amphidinium_carterae.1
MDLVFSISTGIPRAVSAKVLKSFNFLYVTRSANRESSSRITNYVLKYFPAPLRRDPAITVIKQPNS